MNYLSLDFGTSSLKAAIIDEGYHILASSSCEYPIIQLPGEKAEISFNALLHALKNACDSISRGLRGSIERVCYDSFSPSLVVLNKSGGFVYPNIITHLDRRSRAESKDITDKIGNDRYLSISGFYPFAGGCSAMTILWLKKQIPDLFHGDIIIGHLTTYLHWLITGEWMIDHVNASMLGLYKTTSQNGWSNEVIDALGLSKEWLPPIFQPGQLYGQVRKSFAKFCGIPSGIPVSIGTNDLAAAQVGAQNTKSGDMLITAGSSEMISILTNVPKTDPSYYLRNSAITGLWQIYVTTSGGFALEWFRKEFCREMSKEDFYSEYLTDILLHSSSHNVSFTPYLSGNRQSLIPQKACWSNLTLSSTRDDMFLALLSSTQYVIVDAIKHAECIIHLSDCIKIAGGMATPEYLHFKKQFAPQYQYKLVDNCPLIGNVKLLQLINP